MLTRIIAFMTIVSALLLGVLMLTTTPSSAGPLGILGLFVFMYLSALGVLTFLFWGSSLFIYKVFLRYGRKLKMKEPSLRLSYYYASVVALAPVMLIAMQSVGQIGIYQVLLILIFVVVAWVYVMNRTS